MGRKRMSEHEKKVPLWLLVHKRYVTEAKADIDKLRNKYNYKHAKDKLANERKPDTKKNS